MNCLRLCCLSVLLSGRLNDGSGQTSAKRNAQDVYTELISLHAEQPCATDNDCRSLAIGNKACGGPSGYLPLSVMSPYMQIAIELASEHRSLEQQANLDNHYISDCSYVSAPYSQCMAGSCVSDPLRWGGIISIPAEPGAIPAIIISKP